MYPGACAMTLRERRSAFKNSTSGWPTTHPESIGSGPKLPRTPSLASGRHLSGNPTNQACAYGYPEETSRYRLPPANRSRRVCLCVAQTQNAPHSRIPLNAPTKSGDQDVEVTEKKQFPVSGFSGGWNLALGSGKRRVPEKKLRFGGSRIRV